MPKQPNTKKHIVELDGETVRRIDHLAIDWGVYKRDIIPALIAKGLDDAESHRGIHRMKRVAKSLPQEQARRRVGRPSLVVSRN